MNDSHRTTDDEHERLLNEGDEPRTPRRVERTGQEPPAAGKKDDKQRRRYRKRKAPPPVCHLCHRLRHSCMCDPGFH